MEVDKGYNILTIYVSFNDIYIIIKNIIIISNKTTSIIPKSLEDKRLVNLRVDKTYPSWQWMEW